MYILNRQALPVEYRETCVRLLDQTLLPQREEYVEIDTVEQMADAIKRLVVRGAPAIGIAAAYMLALSVQHQPMSDKEELFRLLERNKKTLCASRPTAVNLFWALEKIWRRALESKDQPLPAIRANLVEQAHDICRQEEDACRAIGEFALELLPRDGGVLTHCNAGGAATIRYGTALAPFLLGRERGIHFKVFADETRPLLQGARITAWELQKAGVDVTVICDNMAGMIMRQGKVQAVIVGCDRVAANGDTANKIGTYSVAVLAKYHNIPFYVAAPVSTIDIDTKTGSEIPIEQRDPDEVSCGFGKRTAPEGVSVYNPAFDVTPAGLITAVITNRGILKPPFDISIERLFHNPGKSD